MFRLPPQHVRSPRSDLPEAQAPAAPPARLDTMEFAQDSHAVFARLREQAPAVPVIIAGEIHAWLITRYDVARRALSNEHLVKGVEHWRAYNANEVPFTGDVAVAARRGIISSDPPVHTRLREVLSSAFTPRRVEAIRPWVNGVVDNLIDKMARIGSADLVTEFAMPIPMAAICELFAVPDVYRPQIRTWTETLFHGASAGRMKQASQEIDNLLFEVVTRRRANMGEDFTSALIRSHDAGQLTFSELVALLRAMLAGGNETTINLIGNTIAAMLRHPEQLALVRREPDRWRDVIEEVLRWDSPIKNDIWRFAAQDISVDGVTISKGDAIIIALGSANRDGRNFNTADQLDVARLDVSGHLAFGRGIHHCIGAPLARMEVAAAVPMLFANFPDMRLGVRWEQLEYRRSTMSRGLVSLPVRFTAL